MSTYLADLRQVSHVTIICVIVFQLHSVIEIQHDNIIELLYDNASVCILDCYREVFRRLHTESRIIA